MPGVSHVSSQQHLCSLGKQESLFMAVVLMSERVEYNSGIPGSVGCQGSDSIAPG